MATLSCLLPSGIFSGFVVSGRATSTPVCRSGVTTMKMISSTRHTSTRGVTLMSALSAFLLPPPALDPAPSCTGRSARALLLDEEVHQLRRGVGHLDLEALEGVGEV